MTAIILAAVLSGALVVLAPPNASAETDGWTAREICRAAIKTYFFLGKMPADAADRGEYFGFISAADNVYTCRLYEDRALFKWMNNSGETMMSLSTTFHISDGVLTITTDMRTRKFAK